MAISSSKKARGGGVRAGWRVKMASLRRWVKRARVKGLTRTELVFELHVRRGLALRKVAKVLRVGLGEVREHWWEIRVAQAALAPKRERVLPPLAPRSEEDLVALRECVSVALWETVVGTFGVPEARVEGENEGEALVPAPMLSVRLRALRQMARLYDVDCQGRVAAAEVGRVACATPEEIAEMVRTRRGS
ncbi:MAG: EF-hand domain-containing protein [Prosthecobacter sp.]